MNEDSASGAGDGAAFAIVAAALVLFGAVLRFSALDSGLPNPRSRPDELSVVHEMARPARGQFALERRIYPDAYVYLSWLWVEAGLRVAPLLGAEPTGGYARTLHRAPERIFLLARTLSATAVDLIRYLQELGKVK